MHNLLEEIKIPFSELKIENSRIRKLLGYSAQNFPTNIFNTVNHLMQESEFYCDIKVGYKIFFDEKVKVDSEKFIYKNIVFNTGKIISEQLIESEYFGIFVSSIGIRFDEWTRKLFDTGEFDLGYIADLIGSELAEAAANEVEKKIVEKASEQRLNCTNRLSPGYCGWNVSEQQKLFSLLPENFCDVSLTESSLMIPMKSISGIIGIGKSVEIKPYPCATCNFTDCFKKRNLKN